MTEKNTFIGKTLPDDALDQVVGGFAGPAALLDGYPEIRRITPAYAAPGVAGAAGATTPVHENRSSPRDTTDVWAEDDFDGDRSEFADAAQDAFMQAWDDGDGGMTPEEAFHMAADTIREMMEDAGMSMDNFETDVEMAFEVFSDAMEDGEDPNDAFEIARAAIEEANRDNFGMPDGRDN